MALFVNPGKDWEKNMSEEDIAQMESQGYDVTELRAKRAKSAEEEEKERLREKEERENFKNPTNLNKLAPYLQPLHTTLARIDCKPIFVRNHKESLL